jgi:hypothetical protein
MSIINIPTNDSSIINRDEVLCKLIYDMSINQPIGIKLNPEGPCADSLGLYDLLDTLTLEFKYTKSQITITTCNLIEQHSEYNIGIMPQMKYLHAAREFSNTPIKPKQFDQNFKHFGNFIGHGNIHRLHLASYLYQQHFSKTLQSYHYDRHAEYHKKFVGVEELMFDNYSWDEIQAAIDFLKQTPITVDQINEYPILNPATLNITKVYDQFFVEVVNLTYFSGNTFYIDEKIWRPMLMRTPFLVQGPQNYLINLRKLGFKTFDQWWDEGYSEDPGRTQIDGLIANINQLARQSTHSLESLYAEMQPVLEHNYQRLMEITEGEFLELCKN